MLKGLACVASVRVLVAGRSAKKGLQGFTEISNLMC
jgi:hypothetical protein